MRNKLFPHAMRAWALSLNEGYAAQNPDPAQNLVLLGLTWFYLVLPRSRILLLVLLGFN